MKIYSEDHPHETHRRGRIEVICGSMFSGKTEELIRRLRRAQFAKQRIKVFKPAIDNRYADDAVVSHDSHSLDSVPVHSADEVLQLTQTAEVVGIDEAQFFDSRLVDACTELACKGIRVIVAGLDMDFKGRPFGPVPALCAVAEEVAKVHAICARCGNLAYVSHRIVPDEKRVLIGEKNEYEPLCRHCYEKTKETNAPCSGTIT